ncbi:MAG: SRPBCC domain-containing protein, partial [Vitreoscilla sp.]
MTTPAADAGILIKRVFNASPDKVWRFWTSEAGLEQWWGPVGFVSRVSALDVRVGGGFDIVMRATAADVVAYLQGHGIPLESHARGSYTEVDPPRRLAWRSQVDFVPGVAPYEVTASMELSALADGRTEMIFRSDRMHDAMWTRNAEAGWTQQIDHLV